MSDLSQSLDDIFNGVEPEAIEPESDVTPDPVEKVDDDATAEPEVKEETPEPEEAPAASKESKSESWTKAAKAAVLDERRKSQALEAELEQLRQSKQEPEEVPDVIDNQAGYTDYVNKQVDAKVQNTRIELSQEFMRMQDPEYDVKEAEFIELAKENPQLARNLSTHAMPAKFVVDTVNKAREYKKLENVDEYKAQLRSEVEAEIRAKLEAEISEKRQKDDKVSSIKPSLANARASQSQEPADNDSLDDLLAR